MRIHSLVDGAGWLAVVLVEPGQTGDAPLFGHLMANLWVAWHGPGRSRTLSGRLRTDKAYSSRSIRTHLRSRRITAVITEKDNQASCRVHRGTRGRRPPSSDPEDDKGHNFVERSFNVFK